MAIERAALMLLDSMEESNIQLEHVHHLLLILDEWIDATAPKEEENSFEDEKLKALLFARQLRGVYASELWAADMLLIKVIKETRTLLDDTYKRAKESK